MKARIAIKMNDAIVEDRVLTVHGGLSIGPCATSNFIVPHCDLRVVSHRDRMVIPGHAVLGPGQSWVLGVDNLSVEILYLRSAESRHFEPPISDVGLLCATLALVLMATFWDTASRFIADEPEVVVAATALSARLGVSEWVTANDAVDLPVNPETYTDYPLVGFSPNGKHDVTP